MKQFICSVVVFFALASANAAVVLVPFQSEEGVSRFSRSEYKVDFFPLAQHFKVQSDTISCGPTSMLIVLNAMRWNSDKAPVVSLSEAYLKTMPKQDDGSLFDPRLRGYDKAALFQSVAKVKSEAQVYGKPLALDPKKPSERVADHGIQLDQLTRMFSAVSGIQATKHTVGTKETVGKKLSDAQVAEILKDLKQNLKTKNDYVLVNFNRKNLDQKGSGHISPVGAYDAKSDSFLVMDVNPVRSEWVWVSSGDLISAMNTFDTLENRGYVLISEK